MALIDTGSRYSVIAQDTREQLGLLRVGEEPVLLPGPGTCQLMPTYATRFLLAPGIPFETAAVEMDIGDLGEILGRTVHLFLTVKVKQNWAEDRASYTDLGLEFDV